MAIWVKGTESQAPCAVPLGRGCCSFSYVPIAHLVCAVHTGLWLSPAFPASEGWGSNPPSLRSLSSVRGLMPGGCSLGAEHCSAWVSRLWSWTFGVKSCLCPHNSHLTLRNISASSSINWGTQLEELVVRIQRSCVSNLTHCPAHSRCSANASCCY